MLVYRKLNCWLQTGAMAFMLVLSYNINPGLTQELITDDIVVVPKLVLDQWGFSGDIAVSPKDGSVHVLWVHDRKLYYRVRNPGGSWNSMEIIPNNDIPVHAEEGKETPKNARKCVGITIDKQGVVHIVFSSRYGPLNYMYGNSNDWSSPIIVAPKGHLCVLPDIIEINGDIFACFHDGSNQEKPEVWTVSRINGKWNKMQYNMVGDYSSLAAGENGMAYLIHREFSYQNNHNTYFAYQIPGFTNWIYNYEVTDAERRLAFGPAMAVGNGNIYIAWSNSTGITGNKKGQMFCAVAKEPGLKWTPRFGKSYNSPLFYDNTGDTHPRVSVYSDSTVLYVNSRRLSPGYMLWNGVRWGNHIQGPWLQGVGQVACDGKTVWLVVSSSYKTNSEVSVTGLTNPNAEKFDFENNQPTFNSEPPLEAVKNQVWEYQAQGSDPDGDAVIYSLPYKPDGMTINKSTGFIQWTPSEETKENVIVGVKIADNKGGFSTQYFELEVVEGPPVAEFTADVVSGEVPLTIQFTDLSVGIINSWFWNFGNLETSSEQNPLVTYTASGQYDVSLTVTGPGGSSKEMKENYISVGDPPPQAGFTSDIREGLIPLVVQFTDTSTGEVTSWHWKFGDGFFSTEQNPQHRYQTSGIFSVELKVTGPTGSDSTSSVDYITALEPPPEAGFTVDYQTGERPLTVQFMDTSTGTISSWNWNFGDGAQSTEQHPSHTYSEFGHYTVRMEVSGPGGSDTAEKIDYIQVLETPFTADFTADPFIGENPLIVQFQDLSTGKVIGWQWYFGDTYAPDGGISTEQYPSYTYANPGKYTVILTVQGYDTSATVIKHNFITVNEGTAVQYDKKVPDHIFLSQNYPNPFNAETRIEYGLPEADETVLTIYDMRGQIVLRLAAGYQSAGTYSIVWNGRNTAGETIPSGLYLLRLKIGDYKTEKKMLMLK